MTNKFRIFSEVLPRVVWVIHIACFFLSGHLFSKSRARLTEHLVVLFWGLFLTIVSIAGFIWVIKTVRKAITSKELIVKGPYKYVRHPMYVSIYILMFGIGFLFYSWIPFAITVVFIPIWYLICKVEEKQMTLIHGEKYIAYKKNVGMFLLKKRIIINIIILLLVIFSLAIGILFPKTPFKAEESIIINTGPEKINEYTS